MTDSDDGIVRRSRIAPFIPPEDPDTAENQIVSRRPAPRPGVAATPHLSRNRQLAGDLPAWEPLPPGEAIERRHRHR